MSYLSLAVFITVTCLAAVGRCGSLSGPFYMLLTEIIRCEESGTDDVYFESTRMNRIDKDHIQYSTNFTLKYPFDENTKGQAMISSWGNGGWKPTLDYDSPYVCQDVKKYFPEWFGVLTAGLEDKDCPVPAGRHLVNVENTRFDNVNIPQFAYGKYKLIVNFLREEKLLGCIGMVIEVKPKKRSKQGSKKGR